MRDSLWKYMDKLIEGKKARRKVSFGEIEGYDVEVTGGVIFVESMSQYATVNAQELMAIMSHPDFNKLYLDFDKYGYKLYSVEDSACGLCHGIAVKTRGGD